MTERALHGVPDTPGRSAARERLRPLRQSRRPPPVGERRRLRFRLAYDGAAYFGWQRQRDVLTIQDMLEVAAHRATGVEASAFASGRTDAGVHAEGQCCILNTTTALPVSAVEALLNMLLPVDIRVGDVQDVPLTWNPQTAAKYKLYRYTLLLSDVLCPAREQTAWRLAPPLDIAAMADAGLALEGTHDFRSFRTDPGPARRGDDTVRRIDRLRVIEAFDQVRIEVEGPGFLYMMVRNLAAALVEVGAGRRSSTWIHEVLAARDRRLLPSPAPPHGLCLVSVRYALLEAHAAAGSDGGEVV